MDQLFPLRETYMKNDISSLDDLIANLDDEVQMCVDGGNVGGFVCQFVLGLIFPD